MRRDDKYRAMTGALWIEGGLVKNRSTLFGDWELPIDHIRLVGEATNESGPFVDDWMLIFAVDASAWFEASVYATTHTNFCKSLSSLLQADIQPELAGSTTFNSRIMWPADLRDRPLFRYDDPPASSLVARTIRKLFKPMSNVQVFSDEVLQYLKS